MDSTATRMRMSSLWASCNAMARVSAARPGAVRSAQVGPERLADEEQVGADTSTTPGIGGAAQIEVVGEL
ncbi:hypothetical protein [Dactylosporangium sp. CA-233914]|uniref:hypothetical protein n=1 Tax=Dactylosporangium sp. CA-233914 TaxID=3239934 RepID=UPI003D90D464